MSTVRRIAPAVRQVLSIVVPVQMTSSPAWDEGPLPLEHGARRADRSTRQTYFARPAARVLYGQPERPCRWHRFLDVSQGPVTVHGAELLRTPLSDDPHRALAVLHLSVDDGGGADGLHSVVRSLARRHDAPATPLVGGLDLEHLLAGQARIAERGPLYTVALLTPGRAELPDLYSRAYRRTWSATDQWLWALASRTSANDYPPDPESTPDLVGDMVRLSADWTALALRDGAAFVGRRRDLGSADPFFGYAELHVRTVYLDAFLLGMIQRSHIDQLTEHLSGIFDDTGLAGRVTAMEQRIAQFRSTYWRQHLTHHGPANDLLLAYQNQHRLPARFAEILTEATDYARLVQSQENQQISGALGILTIVGLPLGTALAVQQVLDDTNPWHLLLYVAAALVVTGAILTTRYGRLVLDSLRGRPKDR
ncbi:hypothetical protein ACIQXD_19420 [Streptomyces uncialis]|uniref:hypothetical protein n=1 Tax=Streptomyces uncialis TaxID=1048205 RepID=UPI003828B3B6